MLLYERASDQGLEWELEPPLECLLGTRSNACNCQSWSNDQLWSGLAATAARLSSPTARQNQKWSPELPNSWRTAATQRVSSGGAMCGFAEPHTRSDPVLVVCDCALTYLWESGGRESPLPRAMPVSPSPPIPFGSALEPARCIPRVSWLRKPA